MPDRQAQKTSEHASTGTVQKQPKTSGDLIDDESFWDEIDAGETDA
jgi:hypothetical protein